MNMSAILCLIAGAYGLYALIKYFNILSPCYTNPHNAMPILLGTLAWITAAIVFYQTQTYNSPIDGQRVMMIVSWIWLIHRIKHYRDNSNKPHSKKDKRWLTK